jgi:hypothetical protein
MSWGVVLRALGWVTGAVSLQESRRQRRWAGAAGSVAVPWVPRL